MDNENVKFLSGKIVEELSMSDLDQRIADIQAALTKLQIRTAELQADLVILENVKAST